ncbi:cytochrome b-c1 complex subunit 1, mitochondrial isoform X1 [Rousettus aegyptiacus]|uniref:Cytochrome b-c1 complex subunit 1, mitochondrial n=2 Tax=Rousettus aegyptiacus TaxID=9407 RepID=A0A7J8HWV5_ROUAE|nr:cytochrome b-c1 complex subunit 1, mitochondrial isoform X1 [Rousettus aegyptiacus]KAF6476793.1 ubiquinol-cytochrome c reductase core protein 1 [Rousettus aegyptiacus]
MAASAVCRVASAGTRVLLCNRRSSSVPAASFQQPALPKSPALRSIATFAQALQNVPETQVSLLDNGLRVASEQSSQPTCTVGVWIDVGSRYETEKNNGAGYFVEHLAFKGTKNRPGSALEKEVESMGAHLNAYSTREHTAYYIKALSKDLPKAVELLADIVQNCSLEDSQIEKERDVILQELQENDMSMRDVVFDYLHATAFQGTPLAQTVEGPSENVRKLSRADLTEYLSQHYKAPRMVLAAAGGVEHRQLVDLAQKHFGSVSGAYTEDTVPSLAPCRFTGSQIGHRDDALPLAHVAVAVEGPGWANPDNVTLQVANAIIGHYDCTYGGGRHLSSPLASVAVANKLCQSFQTFSICYAETGLLGAHFVCDRMTVDDMMFFLQGQWMRLCTSATDSEVLRGRNILRNALVSHLDGTTTVCEDIGRSLLTYGRRIPLTEWESRIAEVDAQAVREVCSKYFYDQCPAVAALGPIEQLPDYNRIRSGMFWLRF